MKVSELIAALKELPQEHQVIMSCDAEGNSFSPACEIGTYLYVPTTTWDGDIINKEDFEDGDEENAVCLWPTN